MSLSANKDDDAFVRLEKTLHDYEFEYKQLVGQIHQEDEKIKNIKTAIKKSTKISDQSQVDIDKLDEEIKQQHKQFTYNRDSIAKAKQTMELSAERVEELRHKLEETLHNNEAERNTWDALLVKYRLLWESFEQENLNKPVRKEVDRMEILKKESEKCLEEIEKKLDEAKQEWLMTMQFRKNVGDFKQWLVTLAQTVRDNDRGTAEIHQLEVNLKDLNIECEQLQIQYQQRCQEIEDNKKAQLKLEAEKKRQQLYKTMAGQPTGVAGQPTGMAGQPTGMAGQPTGMAGQPTGMAGQPVATHHQQTINSTNKQLLLRFPSFLSIFQSTQPALPVYSGPAARGQPSSGGDYMNITPAASSPPTALAVPNQLNVPCMEQQVPTVSVDTHHSPTPGVGEQPTPGVGEQVSPPGIEIQSPAHSPADVGETAGSVGSPSTPATESPELVIMSTPTNTDISPTTASKSPFNVERHQAIIRQLTETSKSPGAPDYSSRPMYNTMGHTDAEYQHGMLGSNMSFLQQFQPGASFSLKDTSSTQQSTCSSMPPPAAPPRERSLRESYYVPIKDSVPFEPSDNPFNVHSNDAMQTDSNFLINLVGGGGEMSSPQSGGTMFDFSPISGDTQSLPGGEFAFLGGGDTCNTVNQDTTKQPFNFSFF